MWDKIKLVVVTVLSTLGVLFIIIMLLPDDEDDTEPVSEQLSVAVLENDASDSAGDIESADLQENNTVQEESTVAGEPEPASDDTSEIADSEEHPAEASAGDSHGQDGETAGNTVTVNIPSSNISSGSVKFRTSSLDNKEISQDVFSDYDITLVLVWGTYCQSCIAEMGDYASLYNALPDNVNLIGIVVDVYDGIDTNVSAAQKILSDAGASFINLRTGDDIYSITSGLQFIPSSFLVDSEGHLIGSVLDGAGFKTTKNTLYGYLE